jgi:indole-3-glycerol phosphate synthase
MSKPANILETIVARKRVEVSRLPDESITVERLRLEAQRQEPRRDFLQALQHPRSGPLALIAEIKKASPSAGVIRPDFDPVAIARAYESGGATCLSVLTDVEFFQGSLDYLQQIRGSVSLPLLRKDFIIDPRQILEALRAGADAILLIVAILDDCQLREYQELAEAAGLAALVEVHDEHELRRAMAAEARLIGVNNRDLKTFQVDLATTERLAARLRVNPDAGLGSGQEAQLPAHFLVAESGIYTSNDVRRLRACGACAILVGESLMRSADITAKTRDLLVN